MKGSEYQMYKVFFSMMLVVILFLSTGEKVKASSDSVTYLKIEFQVKEHRNAEFMDIMKRINVNMQFEDGFVWVKIFVKQDDNNKVTLMERWDTRNLHEQHYERIVENGSWANILDMLSVTPEMSYLNYYKSIVSFKQTMELFDTTK
jgi:quinol monooxygenase YgiN